MVQGDCERDRRTYDKIPPPIKIRIRPRDTVGDEDGYTEGYANNSAREEYPQEYLSAKEWDNALI